MESNVAAASGDEALVKKLPESARELSLSSEIAASNLTFLRSQVESWLAVLFNIFSTIGRESQGLVADVVSAWASIADQKVCIPV